MTEDFRCPLCGGSAFRARRTLYDRIARTTGESFTLVECRSCGLLRLHPQPSAGTLESAYPDDYAPFIRPGLSGQAKRLLERKGVRDIWPYLQPPRAILDVGCAGGDLLEMIRDAGNPDVHGLEPDSYAAGLTRERGIPVTEGYLENAGFPDQRFSTVLLDHVLEHVDDPGVFMAEIHRILTGGGAVVAWLPNADSDAARMLGGYWMGYDAPRHLTTFSIRTLTRLFDKHGFRIVQIHHEQSGVEWAWGLRLWLRERLPAAEGILRRLHALMILLASPLGIYAARRKRSGRVRVIAVKRSGPHPANPAEIYDPTA
ncbi:MAG: class I SAM-dependent methyltransferase [Thermomicrobiales bacterium]